MSRKLFVGNLPYSVTSERLQEAFSQFGTVTSSKVIVDRETGRSRGFAFLEMETDDHGRRGHAGHERRVARWPLDRGP